ncbi:membrane protein YpdK [Cronobacter dublinensis]
MGVSVILLLWASTFALMI